MGSGLTSENGRNSTEFGKRQDLCLSVTIFPLLSTKLRDSETNLRMISGNSNGCGTFEASTIQKMKKTQIFIIDDCEMMRQFLTTYLSGSGMVRAYGSGTEALDALSLENWPDVIVLDLNLPDMNGLEIISHLEEKQLIGRSKIIVLSGENSASTRISCLSAGAADYVVKPFHPRELKLRVDKMIGSSQISKVA